MKKRIFIGTILCIFVLISFPSINAFEGDAILKKEKQAELLSTLEYLDNTTHSKVFFTTYLLIGAAALSVVIAALIYIYFSGFIAPAPTEYPSINFVKDDASDTLTVASTDTDVLWKDIEIQGQCDKSALSGYVTAGDVISDCHGEIRIIHTPSNTLLGVFYFN